MLPAGGLAADSAARSPVATRLARDSDPCHASARLSVRDEAGRVQPHRPAQDGLHRTVAFVVRRGNRWPQHGLPTKPGATPSWRRRREHAGAVLCGLAGYLNTWRAIRSPAAATASAASQPFPTATPLSMLLRPLANLTGDAGNAYLADGLTTAITGDLARIQDAMAVPAVIASALQREPLDVQQPGRRAQVRFVMQGSVALDGERTRVTVQLSDARTGFQLWSRAFESTRIDPSSMLDEITARIRASVAPPVVLAAARTRAIRPQAVDLLLRLRALELRRQTAAGLRQRESLARELLDLAPDRLAARAALANSLACQDLDFACETKLPPEQRAMMLDEASRATSNVLAQQPESVSMLQSMALLAGDRGEVQAMSHSRERVSPAPRSSKKPLLGHSQPMAVIQILPWRPQAAVSKQLPRGISVALSLLAQRDRDRGSRARETFDVDGAVHHFDERLGERQTQARARSGRSFRSKALKRHEHSFELFARQTRACVLNREFDSAAAFRHGHADHSASLGVLDGI